MGLMCAAPVLMCWSGSGLWLCNIPSIPIESCITASCAGSFASTAPRRISQAPLAPGDACVNLLPYAAHLLSVRPSCAKCNPSSFEKVHPPATRQCQRSSAHRLLLPLDVPLSLHLPSFCVCLQSAASGLGVDALICVSIAASLYLPFVGYCTALAFRCPDGHCLRLIFRGQGWCGLHRSCVTDPLVQMF